MSITYCLLLRPIQMTSFFFLHSPLKYSHVLSLSAIYPFRETSELHPISSFLLASSWISLNGNSCHHRPCIPSCFSRAASSRILFVSALSRVKYSHIPRVKCSFTMILQILPRCAFFSTTALHATSSASAHPAAPAARKSTADTNSLFELLHLLQPPSTQTAST